MKIGISVSSGFNVPVSNVDEVSRVEKMSKLAEDVGIDSIWVADRTVYPENLSELHPGRFALGSDGQQLFEAHTVLSYVAGITKKIKLGFSVLVLPFRNPLLNAKRISTLDVLSKGRVIFGVGVGWMSEEFQALQVGYIERGKLLDKSIDIFKEFCIEDSISLDMSDGNEMKFICYPKPIQNPHPPIWIGGNTDRALNRVVQRGDGWLSNISSLEEFQEKFNKLQSLSDKFSRDFASIQIANCISVQSNQSKSEIYKKFDSFREFGLDHLVVGINENDINLTLEWVNLIGAYLSDNN
jgi:alkanesulfonate monooxygenase